MKNLIVVLFFFPLISFGQIKYYVSLKEGLNVYKAPNLNSKITATILYGQKLTIKSRTGKKHIDKETGISKDSIGEWVKIEYSKSFFTEPGEGVNYDNPLSEKKYYGYVFDGFLKEAIFPKYIIENYIHLDSMDQLYVPNGETRNFTFEVDKNPTSLTNCYKFKSGVPFTGIAYDIIFSDQLFKIANNYGNDSLKYIDGPTINIYVAEFKNGILTGKMKRINPLEGIENEFTKIVQLDKIRIEKEIIVRYTKVDIQSGDLKDYFKVEGAAFFDLKGNTIVDFPSFNFWVDNGEDFLSNKYENKFLKITYFSEYVQPKGDYGYGNNLKPVHFFDRDCDLYDLIKKVEVIEDFKIKK